MSQPFRGVFWPDPGGKNLASRPHFVRWHETEVRSTPHHQALCTAAKIHAHQFFVLSARKPVYGVFSGLVAQSKTAGGVLPVVVDAGTL